jgi:uncharacterized protein (TIGR02145 family)
MKRINTLKLTIFIIGLFLTLGCNRTTNSREGKLSNLPDEKPLHQSEEKSVIQVVDTFRTVKIGTQEWMLENLDVERFRNGDFIPQSKSEEEWVKAAQNGTPAWCYYSNDSKNGIKYGKLYNWYAINDMRGLSPEGWHVPTTKDFETLINSVSGDGNSLKAKGYGTGKGVGTNKSGFSSVLSGCRDFSGKFESLGKLSWFWSSEEAGALAAYYLSLEGSENKLEGYPLGKGFGLSVRCIKN